MSAKPETVDDSCDAPSASVFAQVGSELQSMAAATLRLQTIVGELLADDALALTPSVLELQDIDRITQTLENLATFMTDLRAPEHHLLNAEEAAQRITLHDLARRLSAAGRSLHAHAEQDATDADDADLETAFGDEEPAEAGEFDYFEAP